MGRRWGPLTGLPGAVSPWLSPPCPALLQALSLPHSKDRTSLSWVSLGPVTLAQGEWGWGRGSVEEIQLSPHL